MSKERAPLKIEMLPTSLLVPYANNARVHSEAQVAQIASSIREFSFTNPVLVDPDNGIIAGNGRVLAARLLGLEQVPCIRLSHLSEAQRRAYIIADNKLALNGGWDEELLRLELGRLQADALAYPFEPFDLAVCFLTLMFLPPAERRGFVARLRSRVRPGGAVIVFDKSVAASGYVATVLWRMALAGKVSAGMAPAEIVAKELSLGGVQRPISPSELGGDAVELFRFGEFAGWIIEGPL